MLPCGPETKNEYLRGLDAVSLLTIAMMNTFGFIFF